MFSQNFMVEYFKKVYIFIFADYKIGELRQEDVWARLGGRRELTYPNCEQTWVWSRFSCGGWGGTTGGSERVSLEDSLLLC